ncbi:MAG: hypothetical protein H7230_03275 [Candidatus Parcubacteria bacterium]|nr:hypothetical protein [Candidatus Paceibacterota bacterium]
MEDFNFDDFEYLPSAVAFLIYLLNVDITKLKGSINISFLNKENNHPHLLKLSGDDNSFSLEVLDDERNVADETGGGAFVDEKLTYNKNDGSQSSLKYPDSTIQHDNPLTEFVLVSTFGWLQRGNATIKATGQNRTT